MATPIPDNEASFSLEAIARVTGGRIAAPISAGELENRVVRGICTDSRKEVRGRLFVPLDGERFDGHVFVEDAVEKGAAAVLVRRGFAPPPGAVAIEVDDPLAALGDLAADHRRRFQGEVVAVAGSAGKTTARSAIRAVLDALAPGQVHGAPGNLNNRIGVPMVLLGLTEAHRFCVVEVGTNQRGEVSQLAAVAQPDVGVLTLVDVEHADGLGTLDDIEAEEGDLLRGLSAHALAVANGDDPRARRQLGKTPAERKLTYGAAADADYRLVARTPLGLSGSRLTLERPGARAREQLELPSPLLGYPGALAVLAAVAVADRLAGAPVPAATLSRALTGGSVGEPGRLVPVELGDGTVIIDDTYNANPASVRASAAAAREIADARSTRLVLVLGEMRELGTSSADQHAGVGADVAALLPAAIVAVGGDAERLAAAAREQGTEAVFVTDPEAAVDVIRDLALPADVILVKASRGLRAERIVRGLVRASERATGRGSAT